MNLYKIYDLPEDMEEGKQRRGVEEIIERREENNRIGKKKQDKIDKINKEK